MQTSRQARATVSRQNSGVSLDSTQQAYSDTFDSESDGVSERVSECVSEGVSDSDEDVLSECGHSTSSEEDEERLPGYVHECDIHSDTHSDTLMHSDIHSDTLMHSDMDVDVSMDKSLDTTCTLTTKLRGKVICYSDEEESSAGESDLHVFSQYRYQYQQQQHQGGHCGTSATCTTASQIIVSHSSPYGRLLEQHCKHLAATATASASTTGSATQHTQQLYGDQDLLLKQQPQPQSQPQSQPQCSEQSYQPSPNQMVTPAKSQPWLQSSPHSLIDSLASGNSSACALTPEVSPRSLSGHFPHHSGVTPIASGNISTPISSGSSRLSTTPASINTMEQQWYDYANSVKNASPIQKVKLNSFSPTHSDVSSDNEEQGNHHNLGKIEAPKQNPSFHVQYSDEEVSSAEASPVRECMLGSGGHVVGGGGEEQVSQPQADSSSANYHTFDSSPTTQLHFQQYTSEQAQLQQRNQHEQSHSQHITSRDQVQQYGEVPLSPPALSNNSPVQSFPHSLNEMQSRRTGNTDMTNHDSSSTGFVHRPPSNFSPPPPPLTFSPQLSPRTIPPTSLINPAPAASEQFHNTATLSPFSHSPTPNTTPPLPIPQYGGNRSRTSSQSTLSTLTQQRTSSPCLPNQHDKAEVNPSPLNPVNTSIEYSTTDIPSQVVQEMSATTHLNKNISVTNPIALKSSVPAASLPRAISPSGSLSVSSAGSAAASTGSTFSQSMNLPNVQADQISLDDKSISKALSVDVSETMSQRIPPVSQNMREGLSPSPLPYPSHSPAISSRKLTPSSSLHRLAVTNKATVSGQSEIPNRDRNVSSDSLDDELFRTPMGPMVKSLNSPQFATPVSFASDSPLDLTDFDDVEAETQSHATTGVVRNSPQLKVVTEDYGMPTRNISDNSAESSFITPRNNAWHEQGLFESYPSYMQDSNAFSEVVEEMPYDEQEGEGVEYEVAALPHPWVEYVSDEGYTYYYNNDTGESSWDFPVPNSWQEDEPRNTTFSPQEDSANGHSTSIVERYDSNQAPDLGYQSSTSTVASGGHNSPLTRSGSVGSQPPAEPLRHLNKSGQTALHISASACNVQALSLLLSTGADPNILDGNGHSPLQVVCRLKPSAQQTACISCLLDHAVDCNLHDELTGNTPLHSLLLWGMDYELLSQCANTTICPSLHLLPDNDVRNIRSSQLDSVAVLVADSRVDFSRENYDGDQALHIAVKLGLLDIMQVILQGQNNTIEKSDTVAQTSPPVVYPPVVDNGLFIEPVSEEPVYESSRTSQLDGALSISSIHSGGSNISTTSSKNRRQKKVSRQPEMHQKFWGNVLPNEPGIKTTMYSSSDEEGLGNEGAGWDSVSSLGSRTGSGRHRRRSRTSSNGAVIEPTSTQVNITPEGSKQGLDWRVVDSVQKGSSTSTSQRDTSIVLERAHEVNKFPFGEDNAPPLQSVAEVLATNTTADSNPSNNSQFEVESNLEPDREVETCDNAGGELTLDPEFEALGVLRNGWVEYCTEEGELYYFNSNNGHVQWKHPFQLEVDRKARKVAALKEEKRKQCQKSSRSSVKKQQSAPVTDFQEEQVDEFYDIPSQAVPSNSRVESQAHNNTTLPATSPSSVVTSTIGSGMRTLTVETKTSPRNVANAAHNTSMPSVDVKHHVSQNSQSFANSEGIAQQAISHSNNVSKLTVPAKESVEEVYTQGYDNQTNTTSNQNTVSVTHFQFPASLSTDVPRKTEPVFNTSGAKDYMTPTKSAPSAASRSMRMQAAQEVPLLNENNFEHNTQISNRINRAPSVSSLSDMTTESVKTEKTTERHMEVWTKFFENAIMASSSVDSDSNRRGSKHKAPYVSVGGFTPLSSKKSRVKPGAHPWAVPPATVDFKDSVDTTFALKTALDEAGPNSNKYFLQKKVAEVSSHAVLGAAMRGDIDIMETLLLAGFSPSCVDEQIRGPLHHACRAGDTNMVELLNDYGVDVDATDVAGQTALHVACTSGRDSVIHCLLQCGVDTDIRNNKGDSALHIVAAKGDLECCRLLMEYGASVDAQNSEGRTPLDVAVNALSGHRGSKPPLGVRKVIAALTTAHSTSFNSKLSTSSPSSPVSHGFQPKGVLTDTHASYEQHQADRAAKHILVDAFVDEEISVTSGTLGIEDEGGYDYSDRYDDGVSMDSRQSVTSGATSSSSRSQRDRRTSRHRSDRVGKGASKSKHRQEKSKSGKERGRRRGDDTASRHIHDLKERARHARSSDTSAGRSRDQMVRGRGVEDQAELWKEKGRLSSRGIPLHSSTSIYNDPGVGDVSANISDDSKEDDDDDIAGNFSGSPAYRHPSSMSVDNNLRDAVLRDAQASQFRSLPTSQSPNAKPLEGRRHSDSSSEEDDDDSESVSSFGSGVNLWGAATSLIGATMQMFSKSPTMKPEVEETPSLDPFAPPPTDSELLHKGLGFQFDKGTVPQSPRPPSIVEDDLRAHEEAYRSGSTPRRSRPPTAPDEVVVAVEMARAAERHRRTPKSSNRHGTAVSNRLASNNVKKPAPLNLGMGSNGYSMVKNGTLPTSVTSRYVDILNDPNNKI